MSNTITEVRLLAVPLENNYTHTLYFSSKSAQTEYFSGRAKHTRSDFSYQRKDKVIRYPEHVDRLTGCNYVMYKNSDFTDKWVYAFIKKLEYVNDERTDIHIETDVMQTWLFDYTVKSAFIEREHVNSDNMGEHTFSEGLEIGEYICKSHNKAGYGDELAIVVGVTEDADGEQADGDMYTGVYSGLKYYAFHNKTTGENGIESLNAFLKSYDKGKAEAVQCLFLAPERIATVKDGGAVTKTNFIDTWYINDPSGGSINTDISFTPTLDGYAPKNKKLLCSPYRFILVSNNNGASATYNFEDFYTKTYSDSDAKTSANPSFKIEGCLSVGCSVRMIPRNYKGVAENDEEGLNLGKYPVLNWTSDYYTNWITQNGINVGIQAAGSVASAGLGIAGIMAGAAATPFTGGASLMTGLAVAGTVTAGIAGVASSVSEITKASIVPAQSSGNVNNGDIITASGENDFHIYEMTIKGEYARIIDSFFTMYGYKVNRVGVPYKNHREKFWYTKTLDVIISGNIPMDDLNIIKKCYNNGITFWKNAADIGFYHISNSIV